MKRLLERLTWKIFRRQGLIYTFGPVVEVELCWVGVQALGSKQGRIQFLGLQGSPLL